MARTYCNHGLKYHRLYSTFNGMHDRCYNPNDTRYKNWGGRGITICDRWNKFLVGTMEALNNFIADLYPSFQEGLTLDRIENNEGYSPDNCRWATKQEQSENARSVRPVLQIDKTTHEVISSYKTLHEANRVTGISWDCIGRCCHNKPGYKTAGGYSWEFAEVI